MSGRRSVIDALVLNAITTAMEHDSEENEDGLQAADLVERVVASRQSVEIRLAREAMNAGHSSDTISIPWSQETFRRKREILQPADGALSATRTIRIEARTKLLDAMTKGRQWLDETINDPKASAQSIAIREGLPERSARSIMSLAFLAPDIAKAAVDGTLPRGFGVSRLIDLPVLWSEQRRLLGLAEPVQALKK